MIPSGLYEACFQVRAVDDDIIEDTELFTVMVETSNANDVVNGTTLMIISDNDGNIKGNNYKDLSWNRNVNNESTLDYY